MSVAITDSCVCAFTEVTVNLLMQCDAKQFTYCDAKQFTLKFLLNVLDPNNVFNSLRSKCLQVAIYIIYVLF